MAKPKTPQDAAAEQAAGDAALLAALQSRDAELPPPAAPGGAPKTQTIGDQFLDVVDLLSKAKRDSRLSEQTLIKAWELNLMWIINNRQLSLQEQRQPQFNFPPVEGNGGEGEGETDLPEPNETITEETE